MKRSYMSNEEFRERIKSLLNLPPLPEGPCVRTPEDRGYYPPDKARDAQARARLADKLYHKSTPVGCALQGAFVFERKLAARSLCSL